jgi:hypothetical protein
MGSKPNGEYFPRIEECFKLAILAALAVMLLRFAPAGRTIVLTERAVTKEGLGSIMFSNRYAWIIAEAMGAQVRIPEHLSSHGYSISHLLSLRLSEFPLQRVCMSWQRTTREELFDIATRLCDHSSRPAALAQLERTFKGCSTIVFDVKHPGYSSLSGTDKCSREWVRTIFKPLFQERKPKDDLLEIGIHLRMGDLENKPNYFKLFNATRLGNIIRGIRQCCENVSFKVATQTENRTRVSEIVGRAEVLDGGDVFQPMEWLSSSRVLFVSGGTYGLLLAQVLDPEVLVVQPSHEVQYSGWDDKLNMIDRNDSELSRAICDRFKNICARKV